MQHLRGAGPGDLATVISCNGLYRITGLHAQAKKLGHTLIDFMFHGFPSENCYPGGG